MVDKKIDKFWIYMLVVIIGMSFVVLVIYFYD